MLMTQLCHSLFQEAIAKHPVNAVCCIVRDKVDPPAYFGYITSDAASERKFSHVYSTGCMGKTGEILKVVCEGFTAALAKSRAFHQVRAAGPLGGGNAMWLHLQGGFAPS